MVGSPLHRGCARLEAAAKLEGTMAGSADCRQTHIHAHTRTHRAPEHTRSILSQPQHQKQPTQGTHAHSCGTPPPRRPTFNMCICCSDTCWAQVPSMVLSSQLHPDLHRTRATPMCCPGQGAKGKGGREGQPGIRARQQGVH